MAKNPSCHSLWPHRGHQEGPASAMASCAPHHLHTSSITTRPNPGPRPACRRPPHQPGIYSLVWGQQDHAGCSPADTGDQPAPGLCQWPERRAAAETHAARRAGGTEGSSHPRPTSVFSRAAFPKEPVGSRSFPPSPGAKENRLTRCLFVCRVITAAAQPGAAGPSAPWPGVPTVPAPPHAVPRPAGVPPLPPSTPGHRSQGTPACGLLAQGSIPRHGGLSLGCPPPSRGANACCCPAAGTGQV